MDNRNMANIVKLNIGGTIFTTFKSTLIKAEYFKSYFERWDNNEEIFIDELPKLFEHVLCYLRNSNYPIAIEYYYLLDYYGIVYDKPLEKKKKNKVNKVYEEMNTNLENISEELKKSNKNMEELINSFTRKRLPNSDREISLKIEKGLYSLYDYIIQKK